MSEALKEQIRSRYGAAARAVTAGGQTPATANDELPVVPAGCCTPVSTGSGGTAAAGCCGSGSALDLRLTDGLYSSSDLTALPETAVAASLGCGNPTALATLAPGEVVLDLGSGGGIDVLLSARRVGPTGKAYGLDMTDEMLTLARENQRRSGLTNVEFLKGDIEHIPLPDGRVDVIISNCVINLAADKDQVFREAFRVLQPGGRLAVSDIVWRGDRHRIPAAVLQNLEAWVGCVAGALAEEEYVHKLTAAGFTGVEVEVVRVYDRSMAAGLGLGHLADQVPDDVSLVSAFVRARKP